MTVILFIGSCGNPKLIKFKEGDYIIEGPPFNDKKTGKYTYYYPDNSLRGVVNYEDGCIIGDVIYFEPNGFTSRAKFENCKPLYIYTLDRDKDTVTYCKKNRIIDYYKNGRISELTYYKDKREEDNRIIFDTLGSIKDLKNIEGFLNAEDSLLLSKSYPDWKEQVKDWKTNLSGNRESY